MKYPADSYLKEKGFWHLQSPGSPWKQAHLTASHLSSAAPYRESALPHRCLASVALWRGLRGLLSLASLVPTQLVSCTVLSHSSTSLSSSLGPLKLSASLCWPWGTLSQTVAFKARRRPSASFPVQEPSLQVSFRVHKLEPLMCKVFLFMGISRCPSTEPSGSSWLWSL